MQTILSVEHLSVSYPSGEIREVGLKEYLFRRLRENVRRVVADMAAELRRSDFEPLDFELDFAKASGCYNVTLNVWSCNESAMKFYEKCGLVPQKVGMEVIL